MELISAIISLGDAVAFATTDISHGCSFLGLVMLLGFVVAITMMKRKGGGLRSGSGGESRETNHYRRNEYKERLHIDNKETGHLLGMTVAAVLVEVLDNDSDQKAQLHPKTTGSTIPKLLGTAIRETLSHGLLGGQTHEDLANAFMSAFSKTFHTMLLVKKERRAETERQKTQSYPFDFGMNSVAKHGYGSVTLQDQSILFENPTKRLDDGDVESHLDDSVNQDGTNISKYAVLSTETEDEVCLLPDSKSSTSHADTIVGEDFTNMHEYDQKKEAQDDNDTCKELFKDSSEQTGRKSTKVSTKNEKLCEENFGKSLLCLVQRSVKEQEMENYLKFMELNQTRMRFQVEMQQLQAQKESNKLIKEQLHLSHSKIHCKEKATEEKKAKEAYCSLSRSCADESVVGMMVMVAFLAYGIWKCSYPLLFDALITCQSLSSVPGKTVKWVSFGNPVDAVANTFLKLSCQIKVLSHLVIGISVFPVLIYVMTRCTAVGSHSAMQASSRIIILGGICGWTGKYFVDSVGGSGVRWLLCWELLCFIHAFATCFTPFLFNILYGSASNSSSGYRGTNLIPYWVRRLIFHAIVVAALPAMAGLAPFASPREWLHHFSNLFSELVL